MTDKQIPQYTERELRQLTRELDDRHHDTLPTMQAAADEWAESVRDVGRRRPLGRRGFLVGSGLTIAGAVALAACGSDESSSSSSVNTPSSTMDDSSSTMKDDDVAGDLKVAALAASLENLAVAVYGQGIDAAKAGKLGTVPPAVVEFATTAMAQHKDHAGAWNGALAKAGMEKVTGVDLTVKEAVVDPGFAKVKDVAGLAKFALSLEDAAAATYLNAIQNALTEKASIKVAATIQPVEMQHSAILNFVLGQDPVPEAFAQTMGARPLTDEIG